MAKRSQWPPDVPRLSVIVLTYNRAHFLPRALDSIVAQLPPAGAPACDAELLVIDDGSTDHTPAVLAAFGDRIRVIRQEHAGSTAGCRTAFHAARGEWLIFVDSDDVLRPGALEALRRAAAAHRETWLVLARACIVDDAGRRTDTQHLPLSADRLANFAAFTSGRFRALIAGGLIHRDLLALFDTDRFNGIHGADLAVLGAALLREVAQIDAVTLDVHTHPARSRDDVRAIHDSGLRVVDMLFEGDIVTPEARHFRGRFTAFLQLERARAYHRARWHSAAWRSFADAVRASPKALLSWRNLRRACVSALCDLFHRPEGPVKTPPGSRLIGHGPALWKDSMGFLRGVAATCGPVARLRTRNRAYLLCEPADALHVLVKQAKTYRKTAILTTDRLLAGGIIGAELPAHQEMRRALPANFGAKGSNDFVAPCLAAIVPRIAAWHAQSEIDVALETQAMFVEAGGRFILGCTDPARMMELAVLIQREHQCAIRELRARYRWPGIPAPAWMPLRRRRKYAGILHDITAWLQRLMDENPDAAGESILSAMRRASPTGHNDARAFRDGALMLFLAAMEPTSITLAWAFELLADHPAQQEHAAAEAAAVLAGRPPAIEHLPRLTYLAQVASEVIRLNPNEWMIMRRASTDDRLPSGTRVRPGEEVMISPYLFCHDARFFPEPERFYPERFAGPPTWPAGAYMPFGAGPRSCLGEHLAKRLVILTLATALERYRFIPSPGGRGTLESVNLFSSQPRESHMRLKIFPHGMA